MLADPNYKPVVSPEDLAELRRYIAEPTEENYTDEVLTGIIFKYFVRDKAGTNPQYLLVPFTTNPSAPQIAWNQYWIPTWDLHGAAAQVWGEKLAALSTGENIDFSSDGLNMSRSQRVEQAKAMERYHNSRRKVKAVGTAPHSADTYPRGFIVNGWGW